VSARPAHLVNPRYGDWNEQLLAAVDRVIERAGGDPAGYRWGGRNHPRIRHPLSSALPLGWLLDMPDEPLPGAVHMPRVQLPGFGPSERFAVSPGEEERAYLHMPGGQSGHPLSPFYRAGHAAWAEGRPASFLPGEPRHRLRLLPGG
jgi:penicillin amidase